MQPSSTAVYSAPRTGWPIRNGTRYSATNGSAPSDDPQTIQRSCRRAVTDRRRVSAKHHHRQSAQEAHAEIAPVTTSRSLRAPADGSTRATCPVSISTRTTTEHHRRRVRQQQHEPAKVRVGPRLGALRKHEREVQEQRRQRQPRDQIRPVEEMVQPVVRSARREREHAEERHRQPEEMERGAIGRTPQPDRGADDNRENPDERHGVVEALSDERASAAAPLQPARRRTAVAGHSGGGARRSRHEGPRERRPRPRLRGRQPSAARRASARPRGRAAPAGATALATTFDPACTHSTPSSGSPGHALTSAMLTTARKTRADATATGSTT